MHHQTLVSNSPIKPSYRTVLSNPLIEQPHQTLLSNPLIKHQLGFNMQSIQNKNKVHRATQACANLPCTALLFLAISPQYARLTSEASHTHMRLKCKCIQGSLL